ncbi:MAG TPA: nitrate/sulfonate/bicarbonate ABC transporter ATP-binding protein [Balneolales bacterium]|nr:nitrate/sulfonate/bicarbonate ABC transporter ATP-binding protein [Balneolales bacterium]
MQLTNPHKDELIIARGIKKSFKMPSGTGVFKVLDGVNVSVYSDEVVALLGRSGSGKSTLLRILAGLIPVTEGVVINSGKTLNGPNPDVAMVFQNFALLPWLTVLENVELGLLARGVGNDERRERAIKAIDMVGLDSFESAYPKELSGGMKQRVGFARAFVINPKVMFLDEPFSALDVLTAENLRGEIDDLWEVDSFPAQSILIVTHNIEEAVMLADRVIILGANPGHVRGVVNIDLKRPHNRNSPRFKAMVDYIYTIMTNPEIDMSQKEKEFVPEQFGEKKFVSSYSQPLPLARVGSISGLLELLIEQGGRADIPQLAQRLLLEVDDLLPILDAASLLGFAKVAQGDVSVTSIGSRFAEADILSSKIIFREQVLQHAPIVNSIYQTLKEKRNGKTWADFFLDILDEHYPKRQAERQFATAIDWGRFAELYEYDSNEGIIHLSDTIESGKNIE